MISCNILSNDVLPLRTSDTGEQALATMNVFHVKHLPIVNNEQLLGLISEDIILDHDLEEAIGSYSLNLVRPYCNDNDHIFEVMQKMAENKLTVIPVVDKNENYLGLITLEDILHFYADNFGFKEPGTILVLEVGRNNYSLAEIARIVESEGGLVIASFVTADTASTNLFVSIKVNTQSPGTIIATFQRYDYIVSGTFTEDDYVDALKERYDSLMSYLNV